MKVVGIIAAGIVGVIIFALIVLGTMSQYGYIPNTKVERGEELSKRQHKIISEIVALKPTEQIKYYYSAGLFSYREDGNLITDSRIISYYIEDSEFLMNESEYSEIVDIDVEFSDSFLEDTVVHVWPDNEESFILLLCNEDKRDQEAVEYIKNQLAVPDDTPEEAPQHEIPAP